MKRDTVALLLAAGKGTRMNSNWPKVLHEVHGRPMLDHVLLTIESCGISRVLVVVGFGASQVSAFLKGRARAVLQTKQLGTGHAVLCARAHFENHSGNLLVLPGDAPGITSRTLRDLMTLHRRSNASGTILSTLAQDPAGYGRIIRSFRGNVIGIREHLDASHSERQIREINSGVYIFKIADLVKHLQSVSRSNEKKEYYLTDVIESFVSDGLKVETYCIDDEEEVLGINSRKELAKMSQIINRRELEKHMANGVTIVSPDNTFIGQNVVIGKDTIVHPFTWIEKSVKIGSQCTIGPYAKIRAGSVIMDNVAVGSFVEVVRTKIGRKSQVKHLSYLGDAVLGTKVNIGAGTITANYDGVRKHQTKIGDESLIGSNTVFVAPVSVGRKVRTGAGAVIPGGSKIASGKTVVGVPAREIRSKKYKSK